jgi:phosphotransferase family enzyme
LRKIAGFRSGEAFGPFGRPGWIEELFSWVKHAIEPLDLRLSGGFRQLNACPTFALIRLETNGPAIWFKAVGEPNRREFQISLILSKLFPGLVPEIVATHPAWYGWLTAEFARTTLEETADARAWESSARTLAKLQIASIGKCQELLEAGCKNLTFASLQTRVDPFFEMMSELMEQQPKTPPQILDRDTLHRLAVCMHEALSDWSALNIPDTLGHLDFNPGNIVCSADRCVFLDWAEACVGPPFLTLEYLRFHLSKLESGDQSLNSAVTDSYASAWTSVLSSPIVSKAQALAPGLAVFAYAVAEQPWQDPKVRTQYGSAPFLRSLTRRMHAEIQRLRNQRSISLATSCSSR